MIKQFQLFFQRVDELQGTVIRIEYKPGMWVKGDDDVFSITLIGQLPDALNELLVTQMHTIKGANSNYGIPE
jgi:hypothetical protein